MRKHLGIVRAPVEKCVVACPCHKELAILSRELKVQETSIPATRGALKNRSAAELKSFECYVGETRCMLRDCEGEKRSMVVGATGCE